jgi:hypothetical protein
MSKAGDRRAMGKGGGGAITWYLYGNLWATFIFLYSNTVNGAVTEGCGPLCADGGSC